MKKWISLLAAALLALTLSALAEEAPLFATLTDARDYLNEQVQDCPEQIQFRLANLDDYEDSAAFAEAVRDLGGQYRATVKRSGDVVTVRYEYYPGMRILHAIRSNDASDLNEDEVRAAAIAAQVARDAWDNSDTSYEAVRSLHDWLCAHVNYESMPDSADTMPRVCGAVGALVDGRANCQGYSDAFRLLGSLVGLEVRKQSGTDETGGGHDWNVVKLNGEWLIVDVTHDDVNDSDAWHYAYMNVGQDLCGHTWNTEVSVAPVRVSTNASLWYYTREAKVYETVDALAYDAYFARRDQGQTVFRGMVPRQDLDWENLSDAVKALADKRGKRCSWTIWCSTKAGNTYYFIEWTKW